MATQTQPLAARCCISGMPCWSFLPMVQPPPCTWSRTGAPPPGVRPASRCRGGCGSRVAERDVALDVDRRVRCAEGAERVDQRAPRRRQLGRRGRRVQLLDVVEAEALGQRVLDPVADGAALPDEVAEPGRAGSGEGEADRVAAPAGGRKTVRRRVRRGQCQDVRGELSGHPAREERREADRLDGQRADRVGGQGRGDGLPAAERHGPRLVAAGNDRGDRAVRHGSPRRDRCMTG